MSSEPQTTEEVLDEIERLDQSITMVLQDIDQSFSQCNHIVSTKILPQIDRYAESSSRVQEQAWRWMYFFRAASAPTTASPSTVAGRETVQPDKDPKDKEQRQSRETLEEAGPSSGTPEQDDLQDIVSQESIPESPSTNRPRLARLTSPTTSRISHLSKDTSTSRPRIGSINRPGITPDSPPENLRWTTPPPSRPPRAGTPPPPQQPDLEGSPSPPLVRRKEKPVRRESSTNLENDIQTTPVRKYQFGTSSGADRLSESQGQGFVDLDVEENHQDVITPPTTLHFSVPESRIPTTPRSVLAKSKVDRIQMKDGLVIPQPIFVNEDEEDEEVVERYIGSHGKGKSNGGPSEEENNRVGGSKKRSREDDFEDRGDDRPRTPSRSWASLTDQERNKRRLLASPRKMASVQDFFEEPSPNNQTPRRNGKGNEDDDDDEDDEEDPLNRSPSLRPVSQTRSRSDVSSHHEDPLLAALATPPEIRKGLMEARARAAWRSQEPPVMESTSSTTPTAPPPVITNTTPIEKTPSRFGKGKGTLFTSTTPSSTPGIAVSSAGPSAGAAVSAGPSVNNTPLRTPVHSIDSIFKQSFELGLASASSSARRQTMGMGMYGMGGMGSFDDPTLFRRSLFGGRKSIGSGSLRSQGPPFRSDLTGSSRYSASPATRAAAAAIASAAQGISGSQECGSHEINDEFGRQ
ncbi:DASH complex subunit ask1 [Mortierella sp. GBA43]|nr:DASH complex subunit ask1 [Mortierella sp. GBA43]